VKRHSEEASEAQFKGMKVIDGLPTGFFDDDRLNSQVKKTKFTRVTKCY